MSETISSNIVSARISGTYSVPKISDILLRSSVELNLFDSPLLLSRNNQGLQIEQEIMKRIIDIVGSLMNRNYDSDFFDCRNLY